MAQELIYTSAPRGLRMGSSGFCTVACTRGMAPNYIEQLESLSGYTAVFKHFDPNAERNPTSFSHAVVRLGGKSVNILSRVAFAGVDHTQRSNKIASHLLVDPAERAVGGPAWMLQQEGLMATTWEGEPRYLEMRRDLPQGDPEPETCQAWGNALGDAGWAGVLAQAFLDEPRQPAFLIFEPGMDMLAIVAEALRLVPREQRWDVTFNTYFTTLPLGTSCAWRGCLPNAEALKQARRRPGMLVLDFTAGSNQPGEAMRRMEEGSPLVACARDGTEPPSPAAAEQEEAEIAPPSGAERRAAAEGTPSGEQQPAPPAPPPPPLRRHHQRSQEGTGDYSERRTKSPWLPVATVAILIFIALGGAGVYGFRRFKEQTAVPIASSAHANTQPAPETAPPSTGKQGTASPEVAKKIPPPDGNGHKSKTPDAKASEPSDADKQVTTAKPEPDVKSPAKPEVLWIPKIGDRTPGLLEGLKTSPNVRVPIPEASGQWAIQEIGYWPPRPTGKPEVVQRKKLAEEIVIMGKHQGGKGEMPLVGIQLQDGTVVFAPKPGVDRRQIEPWADVAWIKLAQPEVRKEAYVLTGPLRRSLEVRRQGKLAVGKVALPEVMSELFKSSSCKPQAPASVEDKGGYQAQVQAGLNGTATTLTVRLKCTYTEPAKIIRAEAESKQLATKAGVREQEEKRASEDVKRSEREHGEAKRPVEVAKRRKDKAQREIEEAKKKAKEQKDHLDKAEREVEELARKAKDAGKNSREALAKAKKALEEKEGELKAASRKVGGLQGAEKELEKLKVDWEEKQRKHESAIQKKKQKLEEAETKLKEAEEAYSDSKEKKGRNHRTTRKRKRDRDKADNEAFVAGNELGNVREPVSEAKDRYEKMEAVVKDLRACEEARERVERLQARVDQKTTERQTQNELAKARARLEKAKQRYGLVKGEAEEAERREKKELPALVKKCRQAEEAPEVKRSRTELEKCKQKYGEAQRVAHQARAARDAAKRRLGELWGEEREKRASSFGRLKEPLRFRLKGQVVAELEVILIHPKPE